MATRRTAKPAVHFQLRCPPDLAEWLDREATDQGISRNTLIVQALEALRQAAEGDQADSESSA